MTNCYPNIALTQYPAFGGREAHTLFTTRWDSTNYGIAIKGIATDEQRADAEAKLDTTVKAAMAQKGFDRSVQAFFLKRSVQLSIEDLSRLTL